MAEKMPLNLEPMERGDNALDDQLFDILHDAVQPDGRASLESQIQKITQLLPEGKPYSYGVSAFLATCYEIAEQIPYDHPSLSKLVTIIDLVLSSSRFPRTDNTDVSLSPLSLSLRNRNVGGFWEAWLMDCYRTCKRILVTDIRKWEKPCAIGGTVRFPFPNQRVP